ncbi:MAG TPA: hypothetical protein VF648_18905 [Pyrinomonadaceae bacterium]|jgi:hypothetical protein
MSNLTIEELNRLYDEHRFEWRAFTMNQGSYSHLRAQIPPPEKDSILSFMMHPIEREIIWIVNRQVEPVLMWSNETAMREYLKEMGEIEMDGKSVLFRVIEYLSREIWSEIFSPDGRYGGGKDFWYRNGEAFLKSHTKEAGLI